MESTIITDNAPATIRGKGFLVSDAMSKSDFSAKDAASMGFTFNAEAMKRAMDSDTRYRKAIEDVVKAHVSDAAPVFENNIDALGLYFMYVNEATINTLYRGRTVVSNFGSAVMGDWTTEKVVFKTRELRCPGPVPYDDWTRAPFASYNYGWDTRDTLRIEYGLEVTLLEETIASVMRRNAYKDKKDAVTLRHAMWINDFFLLGACDADGVLNAAPKRLYGILNEPNIVNKENLPNDLGSSSITVDEVVAAFRLMKQSLVDQLQGNGDIEKIPVSIKLPNKWQTALTVQNSYNGYTGNKWLQENWKTATVSYMPELDTADDGEPMAVVMVDRIPDVGMDTLTLVETSRLHLIGAIPTLKGREEAYSASVAGAVCAAPMAIKFWTSNA